MKVAICDDQKIVADEIEKFCREFLKDESIEYVVKKFFTGAELINDKFEPDIIFMDIELSEENGMDIAKKLAEEEKKSWIVYITSHDEMMEEAFDTNVIGFIVKPASKMKVQKMLEKVQKKLSKEFVIPVSKQRIKINDIVCIEADTGYSRLLLKGNKSILVDMALKEIETKLDKKKFYRINHACIANLESIEKVYTSNHSIVINNNMYTVSRRKWKEFKRLREENK